MEEEEAAMNAEAEVEDDDAGGRNPTGKGGGGGGGRELFGEGSMLLPAPDVALKRNFFFHHSWKSESLCTLIS